MKKNVLLEDGMAYFEELDFKALLWGIMFITFQILTTLIFRFSFNIFKFLGGNSRSQR